MRAIAQTAGDFSNNKDMIDTIVFDLDGTLLNTLDDLMDSVNYALGTFGFPARTYDEVRRFVGNGVRLLVERALPDGEKQHTDACLAVFSQHYDKNKTNKTRPYEGIPEMLTAIKAAGYKTAIVSNKYERAVQELAQTEFAGRIDVAVGERPGVQPKPAPDGVLTAIRELDVTRERCVYIGDSDVDVMTAKNAGLPMIGVSWGFRDRALLERLGADIVVDEPAEIIRAVQSIQ